MMVVIHSLTAMHAQVGISIQDISLLREDKSIHNLKFITQHTSFSQRLQWPKQMFIVYIIIYRIWMYMTCLADYLYPLINESSAHQRFCWWYNWPRSPAKYPKKLPGLQSSRSETETTWSTWRLGRWNIIFPRLGNQRFFVAEEKIMEENGEMYGKCDYVFNIYSICDLPMCSICVLYKDDLPMCSKKVSFYLASDLSARGNSCFHRCRFLTPKRPLHS